MATEWRKTCIVFLSSPDHQYHSSTWQELKHEGITAVPHYIGEAHKEWTVLIIHSCFQTRWWNLSGDYRCLISQLVNKGRDMWYYLRIRSLESTLVTHAFWMWCCWVHHLLPFIVTYWDVACWVDGFVIQQIRLILLQLLFLLLYILSLSLSKLWSMIHYESGYLPLPCHCQCFLMAGIVGSL